MRPRFYLEWLPGDLSLRPLSSSHLDKDIMSADDAVRAGNYPDRVPGTSRLPYGGITVSFHCGEIYVGAEKLTVTLAGGFLRMNERLATARVCTQSILQECEEVVDTAPL